MFLGTVFVCSATMANAAAPPLPWYDQIWVRQIIWYALGLGAAAAVCLMDYHTLARWSFVAYWAAIFCPGRRVDSAHRLDARLGRAALD